MAQNTPRGFPAQGDRATPEKRRRSRPRGDEEFLRGGRKNTIIITNDANATREAEGFSRQAGIVFHSYPEIQYRSYTLKRVQETLQN